MLELRPVVSRCFNIGETLAAMHGHPERIGSSHAWGQAERAVMDLSYFCVGAWPVL